ncbi:MAG: MFS transporter [Myxococcaceae bacterium]|nr:MFS transporter [Myxococcaceae bacterium]
MERSEKGEAPSPNRVGAFGPWRFVLVFGVVSLLADMVYEGARSIIGPYLGTLGASATAVGLIAGAGEFLGYGLRLASAYLVTRSRAYWAWTFAGYALTVTSVPLLGLSGSLAITALLYGGERMGKAVRGPAKDTLLSWASASTGRGKAFGVHQVFDQLGAVAGPLLVAAVLSAHAHDHRSAFGALLVPGLGVLLVLVWLRHRAPEPWRFEAGPAPRSPLAGSPEARGLPRRFWKYLATVALLSSSVASFPLIAFHLEALQLASPATIPVLYAGAMAVEGLTAVAVGHAYDRLGPRVLFAAPVAAAGAALAFANTAVLVWLGLGLWGAVNGILDSTVKAAVSTWVPTERRAVAFGWLALMRGAGLLISGGVLGAAAASRPSLAAGLIVTANALALSALWAVLRNPEAQGRDLER